MLVQNIDPESGPAVGNDDGIPLAPVDVSILPAISASEQVANDFKKILSCLMAPNIDKML